MVIYKYLVVDLGVNVHVPAHETAALEDQAILSRPDIDDTMLSEQGVFYDHVHRVRPSGTIVTGSARGVDVDQRSVPDRTLASSMVPQMSSVGGGRVQPHSLIRSTSSCVSRSVVRS
jgi:hypothetical protein